MRKPQKRMMISKMNKKIDFVKDMFPKDYFMAIG